MVGRASFRRRFRSRDGIAALVIWGLLGACSAPHVAEENGSEPEPSVSLQLVSQVGCVGCTDERSLTPMGVAFLPSNRLAVLDRYEPYVRVFARDGMLVRTFAVQGQGPGELGGASPRIPATWILSYPDVGPAVIAPFPPTLVVYETSGGLARQHPLDLRGQVPVAQAFHSGAMNYVRLGFDVVAGVGAAIERCDLKAGPGSACRRLRPADEFISVPEAPRAPNADLDTLELAAVYDGGVVVADTKLYRLWRLDASGETVWQIQHDAERVAKTEVELERDRANAVRFGRVAADVDAMRDHIEREGMHFDGRNRLWILTRRHRDSTSVFDVFDASSAFLAEVQVDATIRRVSHTISPLAIEGDEIAAIVQHPDGTETIHVYKIVDD